MRRSKAATKLHEFMAHADAVNCLKIGRKSGQVLVTGGDDMKVNMWCVSRCCGLSAARARPRPPAPARARPRPPAPARAAQHWPCCWLTWLVKPGAGRWGSRRRS